MIKKVDTFEGTALEMPCDKREFTDPNQPGKVLEMDLHALDNAESMAAGDFARAMNARYIGNLENGDPPLAPFPNVAGKKLTLCWSMVYNSAVLFYMQNGTGPEEKYSFEQIVAMYRTWPIAILAVRDWANELNAKATELLKNGSGAATVPSDTQP